MHRTIARVRSEFLEMPGLRLSLAQVSRLCGVEQAVCQTALDALVEAKFLRVANGMYARLTDGELSGSRPEQIECGQPHDLKARGFG